MTDGGSMSNQTERERIIAVETALRALDRLLTATVDTQAKEMDRVIGEVQRQLMIIGDNQRRYVESSEVAKLEQRIKGLEDLMAEVRTALTPRNEIDLRFQSVAARQEVLQNKIAEVVQVLTSIRAEFVAQQDEARNESIRQEKTAEKSDRRRNQIITGLGVLVAFFAAISTYFGIANNHTSNTPTPTTVVGHP